VKRAKARRIGHILRFEFYVECSCGYEGPSRERARRDRGAGDIELEPDVVNEKSGLPPVPADDRSCPPPEAPLRWQLLKTYLNALIPSSRRCSTETRCNAVWIRYCRAPGSWPAAYRGRDWLRAPSLSAFTRRSWFTTPQRRPDIASRFDQLLHHINHGITTSTTTSARQE
jgi:hypothetical protein